MLGRCVGVVEEVLGRCVVGVAGRCRGGVSEGVREVCQGVSGGVGEVCWVGWSILKFSALLWICGRVDITDTL